VDAALDWLLAHGTRIAFVVALSLALLWLVRRWIPRAVRLAIAREHVDVDVARAIALAEQEKRAETLGHVLVRIVDALVGTLAFFLVLGEVGLDLGPLIAGAGIAGIAIGFGAQSLVRDVLSGLFILLENQYTRGDVVSVAGIAGSVEALNLRRTILRDLDGVVHTVPNGEIRVSSNLTRSWSRVNMDVTVDYREDLDRVRDVIDGVGAQLADDPDWSANLLEPPKVLRVERFDESGVVLKVLETTKPMLQWEIAGELRRRLKSAFDDAGIDFPFPHRVLLVREGRLAGEDA
jgi:small conductance mechanosensitive channel